MGDAGEGLVDAENRFAERLAEREEERRRKGAAPTIDPERKRRLENLRLARAELLRQEAATEHPVRQEQIRRALADLDRQLAELN
jgi:hypothetical protein